LKEMMVDKFTMPDQVEKYLGIPPLGVVFRFNTRIYSDKRRKKNKWI